jgi:hypothetical protein
MIDPAKEIEKRCKAFVKAVNVGMRAYYKTAPAKAKGKAEPEKDKKKVQAQLPQLNVFLSTNVAALIRTPEEQAKEILEGDSWTCNSGHMTNGARHVPIRAGKLVQWHLSKTAKAHKEAFDELMRLWNVNMKKQKLRDYSRKAQLNWKSSSDPFHLELPDARLGENHPKVIQCLEVYAKATRIEGKKKNTSFETVKGSKFQKKWLKEYDAKLKKKGGAKK